MTIPFSLLPLLFLLLFHLSLSQTISLKYSSNPDVLAAAQLTLQQNTKEEEREEREEEREEEEEEEREKILDGKAYWLHIPKAGTSFWNLLTHYCAPSSLSEEERVPHHTSACFAWEKFLHLSEAEAEKINNNNKNEKNKNKNKTFLTTTTYDQNNNTRTERKITWQRCEAICRRHRAIPSLKHQITQKEHYLGMLRSPPRRLLSSFLHNRRGIPSSSASLLATPADFAKFPGVMGCQARMLTGLPCTTRQQPTKTPTTTTTTKPTLVQDAKKAINERLSFLGITDRWKESVCLFHAMYGGEPTPLDFSNSRPAVVSEEDSLFTSPTETLEKYDLNDPIDGPVFEYAVGWFEEQLEIHHKSVDSCLALYEKDVHDDLYEKEPSYGHRDGGVSHVLTLKEKKQLKLEQRLKRRKRIAESNFRVQVFFSGTIFIFFVVGVVTMFNLIRSSTQRKK